MRSIKIGLAVLAALCAQTAESQGYKCTVDGKVVYQQAQCEGGTKLDIPPAPVQSARDARIALAIATRKVLIGMTEAEVVRAWGQPDRKNVSIRSTGRSEQWIYRGGRSSNDQYLYLVGGILTSAQGPQ